MSVLNLNDTYTLLLLVQEIDKATSFLRDRYFPTNEATDIFTTEKVLAEYRDGDKRLAPFVSPRKNGVTILRQGSVMKEYTPPNIAISRPLTVDELKKRGFGEALLSNLTPEHRQSVMLMRDMEELDNKITRREELMAATTMLENGCVMRHYADKDDEYQEMEIRFYDGDDNPAVYTPSVLWDQDGAAILQDIAAMCRMLKARGLGATDVLVGADVADVIQNDPDILKKLDIAKLNIGGVDPVELPEGVTKIARLNCSGQLVDVLCYEEQYEDDDGANQYYVPSGKVVVTAPAAGRAVYGAVTQMEQGDNLFHTYAGRRIPRHLADPVSETRDFTLKSRPLMLPNHKNPWISAEVL